MPRFLLVLSEATGESDLSATRIGARLARFSEWVADGLAAGVIVDGAPLLSGGARIVRASGVTTVHPCVGPLGGCFFIVEVESPEAALAYAASCPAADPGQIDVKPVDEAARVGQARVDGDR